MFKKEIIGLVIVIGVLFFMRYVQHNIYVVILGSSMERDIQKYVGKNDMSDWELLGIRYGLPSIEDGGASIFTLEGNVIDREEGMCNIVARYDCHLWCKRTDVFANADDAICHSDLQTNSLEWMDYAGKP